MKSWLIWFALGMAVLAALCACATPRYADGTRAGVRPAPCDSDNCGKRP